MHKTWTMQSKLSPNKNGQDVLRKSMKKLCWTRHWIEFLLFCFYSCKKVCFDSFQGNEELCDSSNLLLTNNTEIISLICADLVSVSVFFSDEVARGPLHQLSGVSLIQCFAKTKKIVTLPCKVEPDTTVRSLRASRLLFSGFSSKLPPSKDLWRN